jgi:hypothetical protein
MMALKKDSSSLPAYLRSEVVPGNEEGAAVN